MSTNKKITFCENYTPVSNKQVVSYMNAMINVVRKPPQCRGCTHFTSKSCKHKTPFYKKFDTFC